jgi:hypothetical protein
MSRCIRCTGNLGRAPIAAALRIITLLLLYRVAMMIHKRIHGKCLIVLSTVPIEAL